MFKRSPIYALIMFLLGIVPAVAQMTTCPFLVEQALSAVGDNCTDLGRNSACYGYNQVDATFAVEFPDGYFSVPSDRASLTDLATLRTLPMNSENGRWGVAVMNIQANLPNTVPGQGVIMMVIGDAEVRNDVPVDEANIIADPLSTIALQEANLHASPSSTSDVIRVVTANEVLLVDGVNATQSFFRVVNDGLVAWIGRDQVARLAAMDNLPIVGASHPTPMQAFYLSTGIGQSECAEAEPMIAVQSPENITVDLTVNGVDIRVGSLITFQNLEENIINLTVHRGAVQTVFGNTIEAGQSAIGVINSVPEQGNVIIAWGDAIPATEKDLLMGQRAQQGINHVASNNGWDERSIEPQPDNVNENGEIIHIVSTGETLFGIGRLYDASLPAIVDRNNLSSPYTLFNGQELVIPNPGSGFVGLPDTQVVPPVVDIPVETEEATGGCDALRLTSPLGVAPSEPSPYYWDGIAGATQYQVNIYDSATGQLMGTFYTQGTETSLMIGLGELSVGGAMQWEVIALQNGQVLCGTGLSQPITHTAPVDPILPDTKRDFTVGWRCSGYSQITISWKYAGEGERVSFVIMDDADVQHAHRDQGDSGSFTVTAGGVAFTSVIGTTGKGETDSKSGYEYCY